MRYFPQKRRRMSRDMRNEAAVSLATLCNQWLVRHHVFCLNLLFFCHFLAKPVALLGFVGTGIARPIKQTSKRERESSANTGLKKKQQRACDSRRRRKTQNSQSKRQREKLHQYVEFKEYVTSVSCVCVWIFPWIPNMKRMEIQVIASLSYGIQEHNHWQVSHLTWRSHRKRRSGQFGIKKRPETQTGPNWKKTSAVLTQSFLLGSSNEHDDIRLLVSPLQHIPLFFVAFVDLLAAGRTLVCLSTNRRG